MGRGGWVEGRHFNFLMKYLFIYEYNVDIIFKLYTIAIVNTFCNLDEQHQFVLLPYLFLCLAKFPFKWNSADTDIEALGKAVSAKG